MIIEELSLLFSSCYLAGCCSFFDSMLVHLLAVSFLVLGFRVVKLYMYGYRGLFSCRLFLLFPVYYLALSTPSIIHALQPPSVEARSPSSHPPLHYFLSSSRTALHCVFNFSLTACCVTSHVLSYYSTAFIHCCLLVFDLEETE